MKRSFLSHESLPFFITDQTRKLQMDYNSYSHRVRFTCFPTAEHSAKKGAIVRDSISSVSLFFMTRSFLLMDLLYGMQQSQGHDLDTPGLHYYGIATQAEELGLTDSLPP